MLGTAAALTAFIFTLTYALDGECLKVSPMSTDPVLLYSVYTKLMNVNKVFLDCRLGPTLYSSCGRKEAWSGCEVYFT